VTSILGLKRSLRRDGFPAQPPWPDEEPRWHLARGAERNLRLEDSDPQPPTRGGPRFTHIYPRFTNTDIRESFRDVA